MTATREAVREALRLLGVERLVLGVHEAALPSADGEETGRGSLASRGGAGFLAFARELGFDGVQLGPSGMTTAANPSPYDGTLFSRSVLSLDLAGLAAAGLLPRPAWDGIRAAAPAGAGRRVPYAWAFEAYGTAVQAAWGVFRRRRAAEPGWDVARRLAAFVAANGEWLAADGLYEALAALHGTDDWTAWPALDRRLFVPAAGEADAAAARRRAVATARADVVERWALAQMLLADQRAAARRRAGELGLALYGDVQVGMSPRDAWRLRGLFLPGYRLGAPPSRTNPEGQPWGYPVLHPGLRGEADAPGPVLRFLDERFDRAFAEYDALRVDHPHGLVDPWIYRAGAADPFDAVAAGARLFSSPDEPDHPDLAAFAVARPEQVDRGRTPWDDHRVRDLDEAQVARYGLLLARAVAAARRHGRRDGDLVCEVLSTLPEPLAAVLARHGLGRFRVTQKADLVRPGDVYRSENARPEDWVMLGNHDTPTVWEAAARWRAAGRLPDRAAYVAGRLAADPTRREALRRRFAAAPAALVQGMLADLLACPARHVFVFFTDLLGERRPYNRPGVVHPENWTLRVPPGYRELHAARRAEGTALDLAAACGLALTARGELGGDAAAVAAALAGAPASP